MPRAKPIADSDETLDRFLAQVDRLRGRELFQDATGLSTSWSMEVGIETPLTFEMTLPDRDKFDALLTSLRPLVASEAPIRLKRVLTILRTRLTSTDLVAEVDAVLRTFTTSQSGGSVGLNVDGADVSPSRVLDLYINGELFHDDPEKTTEYRSLKAHLMLPEVVVVELVVRAIDCVVATEWIVLEARRGGHLTPVMG